MQQMIGTLGSDKTKSLQVNIEEFRGQTGVDIREWYMGTDNKMHPTKKGLRIQLSAISQLITFLEQAEAMLSKEGHLKPAASAATK